MAYSSRRELVLGAMLMDPALSKADAEAAADVEIRGRRRLPPKSSVTLKLGEWGVVSPEFFEFQRCLSEAGRERIGALAALLVMHVAREEAILAKRHKLPRKSR